ncbi:MAG TPA: protein kinase, partial [Gemmataceae bacterium]|nr:protein kinase [Gemmataceae bacterium]
MPAPTDNPEPTRDAAAEPRPVPPGTDQHPDTLKCNPPTLPAEPDDLLADLAAAFGDRYQIGEKLGEGGFGSVFRGFDRRLNRPVAVKAARTDADRLTQEARQLAQLRHPGIVTVHDVGIGGRRCFIVSELLSGPNLSAWLRVHCPDWAEAAGIAAEVADALAHAHARGIVHRDVKPANVILIEGGRPVLVDFGIALSDSTPPEHLALLAGTPAYMSPEQARGLTYRPDGRTDVYSLGATLYEMLAGRAPFRSEETRVLLRMVRDEEPLPLCDLCPAMPAELGAICRKAMAKAPADRFTTAAEFAAALRRVIKQTRTAVIDSLLAEPAPVSRTADTRTPVVIAPPAERDTPAQLKIPPERHTPALRRSEAERRQVSVLYATFEPPAADEPDVDAAHEQFLAFQGSCRAIAAGCGGLALPAAGTAFLACFGYPVAREDAPRQAVRAALGVVNRLASEPGTTVRVAVHTGLAVVTENIDGTLSVVGDVTTGVTRLDPLFAGSGVLITEATHRLVGAFFDCAAAGEARLRSLGPGSRVFGVTAERAARNRVDAANPEQLTPLIGRDREVGLLRERWDLVAEGVGHVILLVADPGLGKSRLVRVIREYAGGTVTESSHSWEGEAPAEPLQPLAARQEPRPPRKPGPSDSRLTDTAVIEWYCSAYHQNSPLHPVTDYFDRAFGLHREPDPDRRLDRLITRLRADGLDDPERVALFAVALSIPAGGRLPALNLSPDRLKERIREVLLEWLRRRAAKRPVLFVVEDLHWIDPSTQELLAQFVEQCTDTPVLAVFTGRPEFEPPWKGKAHQTQVALTRLTRRQVGEMMRAQTGHGNIPVDVIDRIAERTDGVPLFVEEFTRLLVESGKPADTTIPATLQDLLLARLERMASDKAVVQLGAAIDRTFTFELIRAASELPEPALLAELDKLVAAGVLFTKGTPPRCSYTFKHALIQDAAYQSLVKKRRQQVHQTIAEAIERTFPDTAATEPEVLARHFTEAGLAEKATDYWLKAGLRARDRSAHLEAIRHLTRGLELLRTFPESPGRDERELAFRMPLAASCTATRGYTSPEAEAHIEQAGAVCERLGPAAPRFHFLMVNWGHRFIQGRIEVAENVARNLIGLAEIADDDGYRTEAHWAAGCTTWWAGDFPAAWRHLERADALYRVDAGIDHAQFTQQNAGPLVLGYAGLTLWALGYPEQAREKMETAVALAEDLKHPFTLAATLWTLALLAQLSGDGEATLHWADRVIALSEAQSFAFWSALGVGMKGAALAMLGRDAESVPLLCDAVARVEATGCEKAHQFHLGALAGALWRLGRRGEAWDALNRALVVNDRDRERYLEAKLYRRKAAFYAAESNEYEATACLARAVEVARQQGARIFDLRATFDLARL